MAKLPPYQSAGHGGLPDVERLRADLADVVDAHQARGVAAGDIVQHHVRLRQAGVGALGAGVAQHGFQCVLGPGEQAIEGGEAA